MSLVTLALQIPAKIFTNYGSGGRPVNSTAFTPSTTRDTYISYSIQTSSQITLIGGTTGTGTLQTSPDGTTWTTVAQTSNTFSGAVLVGIAITSAQIGVVTCIVPATYQVRIVPTGTISFTCGQEVQL